MVIFNLSLQTFKFQVIMGALIQVKIDKKKADKIWKNVSRILKRHKILRGMMAYSVLWPGE